MRTNFHSHTFRCRHAQGTEIDMIEAAIANGYSDLGFSDHSPWPFRDYVSGCRMPIDQLTDYVETINALKVTYQDRIRIHLGLECEYYPCFERWLRDIKQRYGLYLLLGNHFDTCEPGFYFGGCTCREDMQRYLKMTIGGLQTGLYSYLAHPDLFLLSMKEFDADCRAACVELCRACKQLNIPMEYNILGYRRHAADHAIGHLSYTTDMFWRIAAEENVTCIVGVDAHNPGHLQDPELYDERAAFLDGLGIQRLNLLPGLEPAAQTL